MSIREMKQHIIDQVGAVYDEHILGMIDEELAFYLQKKEDIESLLSKKDLEELIVLAQVPTEKNTMPLSEFKSIMEKWRMK